MKSKIGSFIVLVLLLLSIFSNAQTTYSILKIDSAYRSKIDTISKYVKLDLKSKQAEIDSLEKLKQGPFLLKEEYNKFFTKYFAYVVLDKEGNPDGNYASLKTTNDDTRLNLNLSFRRKNIIVNGGTEASFSNNVGSLVSGNDVPGNTTFNLKGSYNSTRMRRLYYDLDRKKDFAEKKKLYLRNYKLEYDTLYRIKYNNLVSELDKLENRIVGLESYRNNPDSLKELAKILVAKKAILKELNDAGLDASTNETIENSKGKMDSSFDALFSDVNPWTKYKMNWISFGISYTNEQFKTYDGNKDSASRINDFFFDKYTYTISFNHIREENKWYSQGPNGLLKSFYYNVNYALKRENKYSNIDEFDLYSNKTISRNDTVFEIQEKSKIRDITGKPNEVVWSHNIAGEVTIVPSCTNFFGLHFGFGAKLRPTYRPTYNTSFGVLLRFINPDDDKAKVNIEIFISYKDLTDNQNTKKSNWDRKTIGINTSVPFSKIFFK